MPISLSEIKAGRRSFEFEWQGESAQITYRTGAYTPMLEAVINERLVQNLPAASVAVSLADLLETWDVIGEDGEALEPDFATLAQFPLDFLTALLNAISNDQRTARDDRKNSGGGSGRRASSGNARTGTR